MTSGHADASPSAASQWLNCPASVTRARGRKRQATIYTAEGSAAHEVADLLVHGLPPPDSILVEGFLIDVDDDMVDAVERYVGYIEQLKATHSFFMTEARVEVPTLGGEKLWGTADVVAYRKATCDLEIVDLKYGKGVAVSAKDNPQLRIYALGALRLLSAVPVGNVRMTIIQPRSESGDPGENCDEIDMYELTAWRDTILLPAVERLDLGDTTEVTGPWCRWCVRAGECKTLAAQAQRDAQMAFDPKTKKVKMDTSGLTNAELAQILDVADMIATWIDKVRTEASQRIDHGQAIPGWKLAAKRAMRKWIDADKTLAVLRKRFPKLVASMVKIVTPAQVEKILERARQDTGFLPGLIVKESSGTTLVREDDPRPAVGTDPKSVFDMLTKSLEE